MDHQSLDHQRQEWKSLKATINDLLDSLTPDNVHDTCNALLSVNLLRGRGLLVRLMMKRNLNGSLPSSQIVQLVSGIYPCVPEVAELLVKRLVLQFKQSYLGNDAKACINSLDLLGNLLIYSIVNEIVALEILQLLLGNANIHTIAIACSFLDVIGNFLRQSSPEALNIIIGRLDEVCQAQGCSSKFELILSGEYGVDLHTPTHPVDPLFIQLNDAVHAELSLDIFSCDHNYDDNEAEFEERRRNYVPIKQESSLPPKAQDILNQAQHTAEENGAAIVPPPRLSGASLMEAILNKNTSKLALKSHNELTAVKEDIKLHSPHATREECNESSSETAKDEHDDNLPVVVNETPVEGTPYATTSTTSALLVVRGATDTEATTKPLVIKDLSEQERLGYQKTIYLTIMSSMSADEAVHKLLRLRIGNLASEKRHLLVDILIKCCIQEKTYSKYFGVVGEKLCRISRDWHDTFAELFAQYYHEIDQYETNGLRNVGKFFGHMFASDVLAIEASLCVVRLTEQDTTSAGRVMLKFVLQEMVEELGVPEVEERFVKDTFVKPKINGLFPSVDVTVDDCSHIRFAINFFTAIGLGVLTQEMRQVLQSIMSDARGRTRTRQDRSSLVSQSFSRSRSYSRSGSSRSSSYSRSRSSSRLR